MPQTELEKRLKAYDAALATLEKRRKSKIFALVQDDNDHICGSTFGAIATQRERVKGIDTLEILIHSPAVI
ncbi:MAG: hypothetical protein QOE33_3267 [Acidobacteriota bacterium]|nr:hypothetical protein [Acidobacteriota bacterium]